MSWVFGLMVAAVTFPGVMRAVRAAHVDRMFRAFLDQMRNP